MPSKKSITFTGVGSTYAEQQMENLPDKFTISHIKVDIISGTGTSVGIRLSEKPSPGIGEINKEISLSSGGIDRHVSVLMYADKLREPKLGSIYIGVKCNSGTNNVVKVTLTYATTVTGSTYDVFTATEDGLVPAPGSATPLKSLLSNGTWGLVGGGSLPSSVLGEMIYHDGSDNVALPGNTDTDRKFLTQTGTGTDSAAPEWNSIIASDLAPGIISYSKIQNVTASRLLGRGSASGSGAPVELSVASPGLNITGTVLSNSIADGEYLVANSHPDLANASVLGAGALLDYTSGGGVFDLYVSFSTDQVLAGRTSSGAGEGEELTISQVLDWLGSTQGSILYRGASAWTVLLPGTSGQALVTNGAGSNPAWATLTSSVGIRKAGTLIGTRPTINFIEGANVTLTIADDSINNRVNVTITSSGGGGGGGGGYTYFPSGWS